jgi:tRNA (mo5U34)-methyltransferase
MQSARADANQLQRLVDSNPVWYHTIELRPGVVTPGWFDLRPIVDRLPWPDVRGKRCLDVGTYDGFLAFELERRGASEVLATDVAGHQDWDWTPRLRARGPSRLAELAGPKGRGFEIARDALASKVERELINVYDLSPDRLGEFDVVVCGTLLLHLRDPLRALEAIRSLCRESFLSAEQVRLGLSALHRRTPLLAVDGTSHLMQWLVPNAAGHRQMVTAAGFDVVRTIRPYCIPFGVSHPRPARSFRIFRTRLIERLLIGGSGVPAAALCARPSV